MNAQSYIKNNFINISFSGSVKDLHLFLENVKCYDDGQGRKFDILDDEIYD